MANFPPLKSRFIQILDDCLKIFTVKGKFLDFGCGQGDVAKHLMTRHGLCGDLLDASDEVRLKLSNDSALKECTMYQNLDDVKEGSYDLITAFDVLEHISKPHERLNEINKALKSGGLLALIVPYRPATWGWDDEFYGHLRRWHLRGVIDNLESSGFEILYLADPTFPVYSFIRKIMLKIRQPTPGCGSVHEDSLISSFNNPWDKEPWVAKLVPWGFVNRLSRLFEHFFKGDELFAFAIKSERSSLCQVCSRGHVTYKMTLGHHVLRRCRHCGSQRVAPGQSDSRVKTLRPLLWARDLTHARDILHYAPQARSFLHVGCGRGYLLQELVSLGWDVQGIENRDFKGVSDHLPIHKGTLFDLEGDQQFDLIALHGELEFYENLPEVFDTLKNRLNDNGTLMIEMVDFAKLTQKILKVLESSMNLLNTQVVCDQLANRDIALFARRKLPGGRLQLWFKRRGH